MITLNVDCEVSPDRTVTFKLPESVKPGLHELIIVLEENVSAQRQIISNAQALMQLAGTVTAFKRVDGLEYQRALRSEWN